MSSNRSLSFRLPHQNPVITYVLPHTCRMLRPSRTMKLPMQFFPYPIASSLLGPKNLFSTLSYALPSNVTTFHSSEQ
jgi:hypothetical protein